MALPASTHLPAAMFKASAERSHPYELTRFEDADELPFSDWEQAVVEEAHKAVGSNWEVIARMLPGRCPASVANFWSSRQGGSLSFYKSADDLDCELHSADGYEPGRGWRAAKRARRVKGSSDHTTRGGQAPLYYPQQQVWQQNQQHQHQQPMQQPQPDPSGSSGSTRLHFNTCDPFMDTAAEAAGALLELRGSSAGVGVQVPQQDDALLWQQPQPQQQQQQQQPVQHVLAGPGGLQRWGSAVASSNNASGSLMLQEPPCHTLDQQQVQGLCLSVSSPHEALEGQHMAAAAVVGGAGAEFLVPRSRAVRPSMCSDAGTGPPRAV